MPRKSLYAFAGLAILATTALAVPRAIATPAPAPDRPAVALDLHERHPGFRWSGPAESADRAPLDLHERHPGFSWTQPDRTGDRPALDLHERHPGFSWAEFGPASESRFPAS
jgi:hypothetical protein